VSEILDLETSGLKVVM